MISAPSGGGGRNVRLFIAETCIVMPNKYGMAIPTVHGRFLSRLSTESYSNRLAASHVPQQIVSRTDRFFLQSMIHSQLTRSPTQATYHNRRTGCE